VQPTVPYKNFLEVSYKFKTKKVDYAIRALQGFEEKILETMSVKINNFNSVLKVKRCGNLGNSVPKKL
jgi:hypothetical protein